MLLPININIEKRILQVSIMAMNNVEMAFIIFVHVVTINLETINVKTTLEHNYDFSKSVVERPLSFRFRKQDVHKKCPKMPPNGIASPIKHCLMCTHCHKKYLRM